MLTKGLFAAWRARAFRHPAALHLRVSRKLVRPAWNRLGHLLRLNHYAVVFVKVSGENRVASVLRVAKWLGAVAALCAITSGALAALPQTTGVQGAAAPSAEAAPARVPPAVVTLPTIPSYSGEEVRVLATPRARLVLGPRISDPSEIVQRSGRMGCVFSFRSIVAGVVEFLFPGLDFFRRGAPLFRVYDPEILTDIAAAEEAMQNYDVKPLLIARAPRRARPASQAAGAQSSARPDTPMAQSPRTAPAAQSKPVPKPKPVPKARVPRQPPTRTPLLRPRRRPTRPNPDMPRLRRISTRRRGCSSLGPCPSSLLIHRPKRSEPRP